MKFIHEDFLLGTPQARNLYHGYAAAQPIIDYHCHLPPAEIADDKRWSDIAELWLGGDHYKWRGMRAAGIDERFCTGDATAWEKFSQYAGAMPQFLRNPLYHWSHLELARYFGIDDLLLNPYNAREIFDSCNDMLAQPGFSARGFMERSNVEVVCTTDDPVDSLEHHRAIAAGKNFQIRVLPTWRPDKALLIDRPEIFSGWLAALGEAAGMDVASLDDLMTALQKRHDFFAANGCRLSDRGLETVWAEDCTRSAGAPLFAPARAGQAGTPAEAVRYKSFLLHELAAMDSAKGWTMQIHYGALRSTNTRM
ncbi:MAG: glucuronate isomerase, partial [Spartobacteria bacterium]